ncbi:MAG: hypothetical protein DDT19_02824 [Syntrophomonadaceae bacterium]|nr:hypothetical protein [Bacillota bacterium]
MCSVSDIMEGVSRGELYGSYGHRKDFSPDSGRLDLDFSYWNNDRNLQREAFAHFFEAYMGADEARIEVLNNHFPNADAKYREIIEFMRIEVRS